VRLEQAGFLRDYGEDDSGLFVKYLRRGSGYYIDVGASELVANGDIKLRSGVDVVRLTKDAVVLSDGTELPADLVVYATGYGSMNGWAADLISQDVADKVGKVWGLGSDTAKDPGPWEGEQRNMWKPTQQERCGSTAATCTSHGTIRSTRRRGYPRRRGIGCWRPAATDARTARQPDACLCRGVTRNW
jgi:cation diffusion facilitator CzcD-associated flavoprotein CzcO